MKLISSSLPVAPFFAALILFLTLGGAMQASARVYTPDDVPNVHLQDKNQFISDPENLLSADSRRTANANLKALQDSATVEVAMVIVDDIGDVDLYDFTNTLARKWQVGKKDKNNGVVVVFAMAQKQVRIHTGSGVEGVMPDLAAKRIIDETVIPRMKKGDLNNAVVDLSARFYKVFTDPAAAAELKSSQSDSGEIEIFKYLLYFAAFMALLSLLLFLRNLWKMRPMSLYERAIFARNSFWIFAVLALISLGMGLPVMLIYLLLKHYYRNKPRNCELCGAPMEKVCEELDNDYLTSAQDMEEKVKSVDYDVWHCGKCGSTEIFPFTQKSSPYTVCPYCRARTMGLLFDRVERKPTTLSEGIGVKVYECRNCHKQHRKPYRIARLAPVVVGGGGFGGGSGGGGSIGGSWGGGGFSGGGASGSW